MIGKLNHVAIAVPNVENAASKYKDMLGAKVSDIIELPDHGVKTIFVNLNNTKIELIEPLGESSPIESYLKRKPDGGMHHICYEVSDLKSASKKITEVGATILGDGNPKIGAHGNPVIFLQPSDFSGTLIELEEIK